VRPGLRWALIAVALVVPAAACGDGGGTDGDGASMPDLALPLLAADGSEESIELDELEGPAVVNLWATWCAPCRRELPDFQAVADRTEGEVRFLGVNIGDEADAAAAFLDDLGVTFPQVLDIDGELTAELGTASLPVTIVLDRDGSISTRHVGPMDQDDLEAAIEEATS
jgi:thiol-disulfide isomerase/thioredoxin